jgi:hypothetical protein
VSWFSDQGIDEGQGAALAGAADAGGQATGGQTTQGAPMAATNVINSGGSNTPTPQMPAGMDPALAQIYQQSGMNPGDRGQGFADWQYWQGVGPSQYGRLASDIAGHGPDQPTGTPGSGAWQSSGAGGGGGFGGSSSSGGGGINVQMPTAPTNTPINTPAPFNYPQSSLGQFNAPSAFPAYNPAATPTAFSGSRQADPGTLSYQNLATPAGYTPDKYTGLSAADLAADPSYQFRKQQTLDAQANISAHAGALRTGNALQAQGDLAGNLASQEYAAADARARQTNQMNNATSLGAYQTNAQTGLAYNQNANANAMNFGQANIQNQFNANQANYGRDAAENQQNFQNQFTVNQANNQGAQAAQNQQFGQAATAYGLNQQAQNQGYQQALGAYGLNAQTGLQYNQQNNSNALNNYQAQVQAALGQGNLALGYQNSNNQYALGMGNLGLAQQGQQYNQGLNTFMTNYQTQVADPWNRNYQLATLGNPGAPNGQGYANAQSDLITGQGNANAAGQVGSANAYGNALGNIGNSASQAAYLQWLQQNPQNRQAAL